MKYTPSYEIVHQARKENEELKSFLDNRAHEVPGCVNSVIIDRIAYNNKKIKENSQGGTME
mgnify:CR=1 FL=1